MKQYKLPLLLSSLAILLPIPVQLLLGRAWNATLYLPAFMLLIHWFFVYWTFKDPRQEKQGRKPTLMVLFIMPVLSVFISAIDYALTSGLEFSISAVFCLFLGLLFAVIGNYLPKVRQNSTLGVKIHWTYTSEENWNATHRFTGKLWVLGSLVICFGAFLPQNWAIGVMLGVILVMVLTPVAYSYRYYRMQQAQGDVLTPMPPAFGNSPKAKWLSIGFLAALLVFIAVLMFTGDITYRFESDRFTVEADFHDDLVLPYDVIESVEYREENVDSVRAWGFASGRLLMGTFQNEEFGNFTRYTYAVPQGVVVLTTMKETYVLSGETPAETKALYETLCEKTGLLP